VSQTLSPPARPRLVILDRDGVINQDSAQFVKSAEEWVALPGSLEAIARINRAGFKVVIATNQSGLGRGLFNMAALNAMHHKLRTELAAVGGQLDGIFICPHLPDEGCECRKPLPGLFNAIAQRFEVDLTDVIAVGDSRRDLDAAAAVGCQPCLVLTGNGRKTLEKGDLPARTTVWENLMAVAVALEAAVIPEEA